MRLTFAGGFAYLFVDGVHVEVLLGFERRTCVRVGLENTLQGEGEEGLTEMMPGAFTFGTSPGSRRAGLTVAMRALGVLLLLLLVFK